MDRTQAGTAIIACIALLAGCTSQPTIVVASKDFTEQVILGEILAQHIERRLNVRVDRKLHLGGTLLTHQALTSGAIDLYPEYTGTALTAILKQPPSSDRAAVLAAVRAAYEKQWHVAWLSPLGFNDTFAMVVRGDDARAHGIATISDAARARAWRLGAGYEFRQRPDGLDGLLKTYGLRTEGEPVTMDLGLLYTALQGRQVDMIAANSTDGRAAAMDAAILQDDRHYFPPYECAVAVRESTLARFPRLRPVLEELSGRITDDVMRKLNYEVDGRHRPVAEVAAEFLATLTR